MKDPGLKKLCLPELATPASPTEQRMRGPLRGASAPKQELTDILRTTMD